MDGPSAMGRAAGRRHPEFEIVAAEPNNRAVAQVNAGGSVPASAVPVGVADSVPAYRQGLVAALREEGFDAHIVEDAVAWADLPGRRALLVTVSLPEESAALSGPKAANGELVVVALLRPATVRTYEEALRAGASGVLPWEAAPQTVIKVLKATLEDYCLLPVEVAQALIVNGSPVIDLSDVSLEERRWLQMLADGATVAELARHASYSEREMFRLLNRLYQRLGARNRIEAVVIAARTGLLRGEFAEPKLS